MLKTTFAEMDWLVCDCTKTFRIRVENELIVSALSKSMNLFMASMSGS